MEAGRAGNRVAWAAAGLAAGVSVGFAAGWFWARRGARDVPAEATGTPSAMPRAPRGDGHSRPLHGEAHDGGLGGQDLPSMRTQRPQAAFEPAVPGTPVGDLPETVACAYLESLWGGAGLAQVSRTSADPDALTPFVEVVKEELLRFLDHPSAMVRARALERLLGVLPEERWRELLREHWPTLTPETQRSLTFELPSSEFRPPGVAVTDLPVESARAAIHHIHDALWTFDDLGGFFALFPQTSGALPRAQRATENELLEFTRHPNREIKWWALLYAMLWLPQDRYDDSLRRALAELPSGERRQFLHSLVEPSMSPKPTPRYPFDPSRYAEILNEP